MKSLNAKLHYHSTFTFYQSKYISINCLNIVVGFVFFFFVLVILTTKYHVSFTSISPHHLVYSFVNRLVKHFYISRKIIYVTEVSIDQKIEKAKKKTPITLLLKSEQRNNTAKPEKKQYDQ